MIDKFNFYDVFGYFMPGAALLLLLWLPYGLVKNSWPSSNWASAILGVAGAYLAGQVLQMICTKVLPSTFANGRFPSAVVLDQGSSLHLNSRKGLAAIVKKRFNLDLEVEYTPRGEKISNKEEEREDQEKRKAVDSTRNSAFFLARQVVMEAKETSYGEQFEGMYALQRGLAASFAIACANCIGWAFSILHPSWLDSIVVVVITISLLAGDNLSAHLVRSNVKGELARRLEFWTGVVLLLVAMGFGYVMGRHFGVTRLQAGELGLCAMGALMACLRSYGAYRYQANNFALTIWRDFYVLGSKDQPPSEELHVSVKMVEEQKKQQNEKGWGKLPTVALSALLIVSVVVTVSVIVYCMEREQRGRSPLGKTEPLHVPEKPSTPSPWRFIVSGDSRNCGDVIMPAIAAHSARNYQPLFYWHLGDLRAIFKVDEDMALVGKETNGKKLACSVYLKQAWPDFVQHQIYPFGKTPFYLGLGNHEVISPKGYPVGDPETLQPEINSAQFTSYFADWLLPPAIKAQRWKDHDCDDPSAAPCIFSARNYYHWIQGGVDFIYLDNASNIFGQKQLDWFKDRVNKARKDGAVRTLIVGMHEALPDSLSTDHAMCDPELKESYKEKYPYDQSCREGREAYQALLDFQNDAPEKQVYVLASHSHFFMDGIFKISGKPTAARLRGWIVGTGGAERYKLPPNSELSNYAETNVYGYLVGTVDEKGNVQFAFQVLSAADVPDDVHQRYQSTFVNWCFANNSRERNGAIPTNDCSAATPEPSASPKL